MSTATDDLSDASTPSTALPLSARTVPPLKLPKAGEMSTPVVIEKTCITEVIASP